MALRLSMRAAMTAASLTVLGFAGAAQAQTNMRDYQDCRWEQNARVQYPFYVDQNGCLRGPAQSGDRAVTGSISNGAVAPVGQAGNTGAMPNGNVNSPVRSGSGTSPVVAGNGANPIMDRPTRGSGTAPVADRPSRGGGTSPVVDSGNGIDDDDDDVVSMPDDTKSNNGKGKDKDKDKEAMLGNPGNDKPKGRAGEKGPEFAPDPGVKGRSDGPDRESKSNDNDKDTGNSK